MPTPKMRGSMADASYVRNAAVVMSAGLGVSV
jgi:hypothetical protein